MQLNIVDYIIIAVLVLSGLVGLRKGLFLVVGGLMGVLVGLLAAITFHRELAQYLENSFGVKTLLAAYMQDKLPLPVLHPGLVEALGYEPGGADPAFYLASSFVIAISFLFILILGSKLVQILCHLLDYLLAHGILSGVNRSLGIGLMLIQNLLIMAVLAGLLLPPLEILANLGISGASVTTRYMQESLLLEPLIRIFEYLKAWG